MQSPVRFCTPALRAFATSTPSGREIPKLRRSQSFKVGSDVDETKSESTSSKQNEQKAQEPVTVVITGAAGNLGRKAATHLLNSKTQRYKIILLDAAPCPKEYQDVKGATGNTFQYIQSDLSKLDKAWVEKLRSAYACFMFAAQNPQPDASAYDAFRSMMISSNLLEACATLKIPRVIFASSNHVMGGLMKDTRGKKIEADARPVVGTKYHIPYASMDSTLYASAKIATEAQIRSMVESGRLARAIILRIGFCQSGKNEKRTLPVTGKSDKDSSGRSTSGRHEASEEAHHIMEWWKGMYLSNDDFAKLVDRCLAPDLNKNAKKVMFANGVSANPSSRWSLENDICYQPSQQSA